MGKRLKLRDLKERKRKFSVGGKQKAFSSFQGDTTSTKSEAESLATWMEKWPNTKVTTKVTKEGSRYRVWFREDKIKKRRRR